MRETSEYVRLQSNLAKLSLTKMSEYLPGYLDDPSAKEKTAVQIMRELTDEEIRFRDERAADMNFKLSNFPYRKTIDEFDFGYQPSIDKKIIDDLRTLRFVETGANVLFIGSSGVGKTHLATGLGIDATNSHISTYFISFHNLIVRLKKAASEGREEYAIKNLNKYKLLIIDEIGYFPVDQVVAELLFQLVAARYEKRSIIITTNQPLSRWGKILSDPVIANATVDRLVHHSTIVRISGKSYRIRGKLSEDETSENFARDPRVSSSMNEEKKGDVFLQPTN